MRSVRFVDVMTATSARRAPTDRLPILYYLTNLHQSVIVTLRRGTGRRGLGMSATASHHDNPVSAHDSRVVSIGQYGSTDPEPSAASSEHSLSMMRQAFGGLLANTERSMSSSTDQRGELERPMTAKADSIVHQTPSMKRRTRTTPCGNPVLTFRRLLSNLQFPALRQTELRTPRQLNSSII